MHMSLWNCETETYTIHKIAIFSTILFNSFISFEWCNHGLIVNSSPYIHHSTVSLFLLLATGMSELDKIYPLPHPSGPSNVIRDSSVKITKENQFSCISWSNFKIFALVRGGCLGDLFTDPNTEIILLLLSLTPSNSTFSKIWGLIKSGCLTITRFSLRSSRRSNLLKLFLFFLSTAFFIVRWSLQSLFDISKVGILSFIYFIFYFSAIIKSFPLPMFHYILWTKEKIGFIRFQSLKLVLV